MSFVQEHFEDDFFQGPAIVFASEHPQQGSLQERMDVAKYEIDEIPFFVSVCASFDDFAELLFPGLVAFVEEPYLLGKGVFKFGGQDVEMSLPFFGGFLDVIS